MEINKLLPKQKKNVYHPPVDDKDPSIFSWKRFWQARGITVWKWSKTWRWEITDMFWGMMNWKHLKLTHPKTQVVLFHVYMGTWASWRGICGGSLLFCLPGIHSSFLSYNNLSYSERGVLAFPLDLELRGAPLPPALPASVSPPPGKGLPEDAAELGKAQLRDRGGLIGFF